MAFDRILTMDDDNLSSVRALARELAVPAQQLAVIEPMTSHCQRLRAREVPDPYYGGDQGFEDVLDLLEDACGGLLDTLRPA